MGDTGALTTGMVLVFCAIAVMSARPDFLNVDYNPAMVALSPLIIPASMSSGSISIVCATIAILSSPINATSITSFSRSASTRRQH